MFVLRGRRCLAFAAAQLTAEKSACAMSIAAKLNYADNEEAAAARPYADLPRHTKLETIRDFLPGGQFANASLVEYADGLRRKHGDIFVLSGMFGNSDQVLTFNTKDIEHVFRNEGVWPHREGFDSIGYFREKVRPDVYSDTKGLLTTQGEDWAQLRSALNPIIMQPRNIKMYIRPLSLINDEFIERIKEIRDAETFEVPDDFEEEICRLIFDSISLIALNREMGLIRKRRDNPDAIKLFQTSREIFRYVFKLDMQPSLWKYVATPTFNKMMRTLGESLDVTMRLVNETKQIVEQNKLNSEKTADFSIFEKMISLNPKIATIMAMDIMFAGVDATATLYSAILLCLAKNPEKQQKLREEVMRIMPTKDTVLDEARMKDLPYMRAVIKEALRYYPNGVGTFRSSPNDMTLSGYRIPKGVRVMVCTNMLLKDEAYYPRPNEFLPERWLRSASAQKKNDIPPFTFLPFGFGPRMCLGKRIVDLEIETALAKLIRNFHVEFNYDATNPYKLFFVMEPAIPFKFKFTDVQD